MDSENAGNDHPCGLPGFHETTAAGGVCGGHDQPAAGSRILVVQRTGFAATRAVSGQSHPSADQTIEISAWSSEPVPPASPAHPQGVLGKRTTHLPGSVTQLAGSHPGAADVDQLSAGQRSGGHPVCRPGVQPPPDPHSGVQRAAGPHGVHGPAHLQPAEPLSGRRTPKPLSRGGPDLCGFQGPGPRAPPFSECGPEDDPLLCRQVRARRRPCPPFSAYRHHPPGAAGDGGTGHPQHGGAPQPGFAAALSALER